ncbi:MAG TPA: DUF3099 domain-containing protein [Mycobacteriales bacterium]|nr:DUF3099 domain-containing protein [Mycobacteriales bacterium]
MARDGDAPILVTTAAPNPADERRDRERRYLITMAVRVVMFIAAIVLARQHWWAAAAVAITLSLVLPWIAVVAANAPRRARTGRESPSLYRGREPRELEGPEPPAT